MMAPIARAPSNKLNDQTPSKFVLECLKENICPPNNLALDLPCGYGRHSFLLASQGFNVVGLDIDSKAISHIDSQVENNSLYKIKAICADANSRLPFENSVVGTVVVVHYVQSGLLIEIERVLAPGGYLIFETFGGNGKNWINLPTMGSIASELSGRFEFLQLQEKKAGPSEEERATIKLFAKKK